MFIDINKIASELDNYNLNLPIDKLNIFKQELAAKVESQRWHLGLITTLNYHTNINGILQRIPTDGYNIPETDDAQEVTYNIPKSGQFARLPERGYGWISNPGSPDSQRWGRIEVIQALIAIAKAWKDQGNILPIVYGDISLKNGGPFPPHVSHQSGIDIDIRPIGFTAGRVTVTSNYNRAKTRQFIGLLMQNGLVAVDKIGFQDPIFVAEGLTLNWNGHKDHLHVRFKL